MLYGSKSNIYSQLSLKHMDETVQNQTTTILPLSWGEFSCKYHDDVIKWKYFPRYLPFVRGIYRSPVDSSHKGQWRWGLMSSLISVVLITQTRPIRQWMGQSFQAMVCPQLGAKPWTYSGLIYRWLSARLRWLQCVNNGVTGVLR